MGSTPPASAPPWSNPPVPQSLDDLPERPVPSFEGLSLMVAVCPLGYRYCPLRYCPDFHDTGLRGSANVSTTQARGYCNNGFLID